MICFHVIVGELENTSDLEVYQSMFPSKQSSFVSYNLFSSFNVGVDWYPPSQSEFSLHGPFLAMIASPSS